MTYIVQRKDRFYVVAYDGLDPLTGRNADDGIPSATTAPKPNELAARLDRERDRHSRDTAGPSRSASS